MFKNKQGQTKKYNPQIKIWDLFLKYTFLFTIVTIILFCLSVYKRLNLYRKITDLVAEERVEFRYDISINGYKPLIKKEMMTIQSFFE